MVHTTLAATPEGVIIRQLVEAHRHIAQRRIHLHHCIARRQRENLSLRPSDARQRKRIILYTLRNAQPLIVRVHYQSRRRNIVLVAPCLDVTKPSEVILRVQRYHRLALLHLRCHVLMRTLRYTRAALLRRNAYSLQNQIHVLLVRFVCHQYSNVLSQL